MSRPGERPAPAGWAWLGVGFTLALMFGYLSHWVIFEYDIFWHVRAGLEILAGQGVQQVDRWSFTVNRQPWINIQWLSTVVDALLYRLGEGYGALSWLRSTLVASWIFALATFVRKGAGPSWSALALTFLLVPWLYLIASFRLQMRPDLFGICCGAVLLALWLSGFSGQTKRFASLPLLVLWANFHAGTCLFGILFFGAAVAFGCAATGEETWARKALWIAAGCATWFATPIGWLAVGPAVAHLSYNYTSAVSPNHDQQPFHLSLLRLSEGGWTLRLWLVYTAVAWACTARLVARPALLPALYRRVGFTLLVEAVLTALAFMRIRAIPYQLTFTLPLVGAGLQTLVQSRPAARRLTIAGCLAGGVFLWAIVLPDQLLVSQPLGSEVSDVELPIESVAFLRKVKPAHHLLNAFAFGGYLIGQLPEYPVAMDGRFIIFWPFMAELDAAKTNPSIYAAFLKRWSINAVLEVPPGMLFDRTRGLFSDTYAALYPREEWAQVFFDNASVVFLRRTPENQPIIDRYEYRSLNRGLPPSLGAELAGLSAESRSAIEVELDRCLNENPRCIYCLIGKASFARERGDTRTALELLERGLTINPNSSDVLIVLSSLYGSLGRTADAETALRRFRRLTTAPN